MEGLGLYGDFGLPSLSLRPSPPGEPRSYDAFLGSNCFKVRGSFLTRVALPMYDGLDDTATKTVKRRMIT